jgi:molybdate transport system substrate-binding protein
MAEAEAQNIVEPDSAVQIATNRLSFVVPAESDIRQLDLSPGSIADALGPDMFAMADPDHVPAGRYAKQALLGLNLWDIVKTRQLRTDNVRAALAFVARGETPLGIVYRTDDLADDNVRAVAEIPGALHCPIEYLAAPVGAASAATEEFLVFLRSETARSILVKFGFVPIAAAPVAEKS